MKLKRFLLRYYPPGIILEYVKKNGETEDKSIDLLNLTAEYFPLLNLRTDVEVLVNQILFEEPTISEQRKP
jgi:dynein assembly factor with WDR repeat domains 1